MLAIVIIGVISAIIYINYSQESAYQATLTKAKAFATSVPISLPTSFVSAWKFDGNTAVNSPATTADLADSWGSNNATTVTGTTVLSGNDCMYGKCLSFNGTSDKISTTSTTGIFNKRSNWTISAWVKPASDGGKDCFYSEENNSVAIFNACINADNNVSVSMYRGGSLVEINTSASSTKVSRGKWNYVLISLEKGDTATGILKFWLNGDLIFASNNQTMVDYTVTGDVQQNIGVGGVNTDYFKGSIDDIQTYSDYLSSTQVATTTNSSIAGTCGTANSKAYAYTDTSYGSDTFCTTGTADPATPSFPSEGGSASWTCNGTNGGANASCGSTRLAGLPTAPASLACSAGSASSVNCTWGSVDGATYYVLDRTSPSNYTYNNVTSTTQADSSLICSTGYNYGVKACNTNGCSSSVTASATTTACTTPTLTLAKNSASPTNTIDISYNLPSGAEKTVITRATSWEKTSAGSMSENGLTRATVYCYQAKSCNSSNACSATTEKCIATNAILTSVGINNDATNFPNFNSQNMDFPEISGGNLYWSGNGRHVAKYNGTTWTNITSNLPGTVYWLALCNGVLYAESNGVMGGSFVYKVFSYNGSTWDGAIDMIDGGNGHQKMGFCLNNTLYVMSTGYLYKYSGGAWSSVGAMAGTGHAILVNSGKVYLSTFENKTYSFDGTTITDMGDFGVHSFIVYNSNLYATKTLSDGTVYRYDGGTTWTAVSTIGTPSDSYPYMYIEDGKLYAGIADHSKPAGQKTTFHMYQNGIWYSIGTSPIDYSASGSAIVYNGSAYMGGNSGMVVKIEN